MALFNRNGASSELPESQIEYNNTNGAKRWVVLLIYIILALVVATLVVFAGRWVYHKVSNNSGPAPTTIAPEGTNQGTTSSPSPAEKAPSTSVTAPPTTTPSPSSSSTKPNPTPSTLPNNGPGEQAVAMFLAISIVSYGLHYAIHARRQLS
jgi:cytoskeletal protein RodZ